MAQRSKKLMAGMIVFGVAVVAVVVLAVAASSAYLSRQDRTAQAGPACSSGAHANHRVVIQQGKVTPEHTTAPRCDTLTITNLDSTGRLLAFGPHEHHVPYDGVAERVVSKGQSLTVTLVQAGNFRFHDHLHDEVQGTFTVTSGSAQ